jgi:hypothetical protein
MSNYEIATKRSELEKNQFLKPSEYSLLGVVKCPKPVDFKEGLLDSNLDDHPLRRMQELFKQLS